MDREIGDVYVTKEYNLFSFLETNREVIRNKKLEDSILKNGILKPIAVNSTMQIIDGQHRYSIAKKYELEIPYYVTINKAMNDIIQINNTTSKWNVMDYINKFVLDEHEEYKKLKQIIEEYDKIPLEELVSVGMGSKSKRHKLITKVKNGEFEFYNYHEFLIILKNYSELLRMTQIKNISAVFQAYFNLSSIKKYDQKWFVKKVNGLEVDRKILGIRKSEKVFAIFLEAYNHNLKQISKNGKAINYELDLAHNPIVHDDIEYNRIDQSLL
jgi:hypothetical protein